MKRSRIFLGLTTVCLAIAGVVAAKASNFAKANGFYITSGGACVAGLSGCVYNSAGTFTCLTANGVTTYYTSKTTNQVKCNTTKILRYNQL